MIRLPTALALASAAALLVAAHPARAEERDFCADRPGLNSPPCTMAPGSAMIESGVVSWEHSGDPTGRSDTITTLDSVLRYGLGPSTEIALGFDGWHHVRTRDASGVAIARGVGDVSIGIKQGLAGANGPVALIAEVSLPTGSNGMGAGDWGASAKLPVLGALPGGFAIFATPEVDAAVNASGHGRHLAWGSAFGLSHGLGKTVTAGAEIGFLRDEDPAGSSTQAAAAGTLAWMVGRNLQLDFESDVGLNKDTPDLTIHVGFATRF